MLRMMSTAVQEIIKYKPGPPEYAAMTIIPLLPLTWATKHQSNYLRVPVTISPVQCQSSAIVSKRKQSARVSRSLNLGLLVEGDREGTDGAHAREACGVGGFAERGHVRSTAEVGWKVGVRMEGGRSRRGGDGYRELDGGSEDARSLDLPGGKLVVSAPEDSILFGPAGEHFVDPSLTDKLPDRDGKYKQEHQTDEDTEGDPAGLDETVGVVVAIHEAETVELHSETVDEDVIDDNRNDDSREHREERPRPFEFRFIVLARYTRDRSDADSPSVRADMALQFVRDCSGGGLHGGEVDDNAVGCPLGTVVGRLGKHVSEYHVGLSWLERSKRKDPEFESK